MGEIKPNWTFLFATTRLRYFRSDDGRVAVSKMSSADFEPIADENGYSWVLTDRPVSLWFDESHILISTATPDEVAFIEEGTAWGLVVAHRLGMTLEVNGDAWVAAPAWNLADAVKSILGRLTDEERLGVMRNYCQHCGRKELPCHCWNDE